MAFSSTVLLGYPSPFGYYVCRFVGDIVATFGGFLSCLIIEYFWRFLTKFSLGMSIRGHDRSRCCGFIPKYGDRVGDSLFVASQCSLGCSVFTLLGIIPTSGDGVVVLLYFLLGLFIR